MSPGEVVLEGVVVEQPTEPEAVRATTAGEVFVGPLSGRPGNDLSGVKYVGRKGIEGCLMSTDAVVDVLAMDRGLFDAAKAARARTHWLHGGEPGNLALFDGDGHRPGNPVEDCCVPPLGTFVSVMTAAIVCAWHCLAPLWCECWCCCCCRKSTPHEHMAFPDWADRALVFTDKGVVGRQEFTGRVNAITWDGFKIEDVRIRTFDAPCLYCHPRLCCDKRFEADPLETACYFGFLVPCGRCALCRPEAPGLYRATISSIHHKISEGPRGGDEGPMASIEVLALARSPDDLRSSLRAAKEKYGAPTAAEMAR
jgi:hypothetical protein